MKKLFYPLSIIVVLAFGLASCQDTSIGHIEATKLVMLEKIPMADNRFEENFKAALELFFPYECHDTVFIQEQVFLERIDIEPPYRREFAIAPSLMRDFFGSNNPDKKKALREDLLFFGDTCFEMRPDKPFLRDTASDVEVKQQAIAKYLSRNRKNSLIYFLGNDTAYHQYEAGGVSRPLFSDYAKLNCRIVSDLRELPKEEQIQTSVIIIILPAEPDPAPVAMKRKTPSGRKVIPVAEKKSKPARTTTPVSIGDPPCPPDSNVTRINKHYNRIITQFRNLLYYIATTRDDADLRQKYREDAFTEIHRIPDVLIEGIPGGDLNSFLKSGFSKNVMVKPLSDRCSIINGIRIITE